METTKLEFAAVEAVTKTDDVLIELSESQLALIGGGCGEVLFG